MFIEILERLATALDRAAIPYMVIGGQAVLVYGEPRLTRDIDVMLGIDVDRLQEVRALAAAIGLQVLVDEQFTRQTMVLPCEDAEGGVRVDFIFSFTSYERQAIARANTIKVGSADVRFAAVEDLIVHKVLAGRARDLEDVKAVILKQPGADHSYIRTWLTQFATATDQPLVERFENVLKDLS
jgi:predicted nucleotidyltransferase